MNQQIARRRLEYFEAGPILWQSRTPKSRALRSAESGDKDTRLASRPLLDNGLAHSFYHPPGRIGKSQGVCYGLLRIGPPQRAVFPFPIKHVTLRSIRLDTPAVAGPRPRIGCFQERAFGGYLRKTDTESSKGREQRELALFSNSGWIGCGRKRPRVAGEEPSGLTHCMPPEDRLRPSPTKKPSYYLPA